MCSSTPRGGKGRRRGGRRAALPAEGMREEARADPAPSLKRLPGRPTTGPAKPGRPAPRRSTPGLRPRGGSWGRVALPLPGGPTQLLPLAPFQLVIAAVVRAWTPPQFNLLAPVRGRGGKDGGGREEFGNLAKQRKGGRS